MGVHQSLHGDDDDAPTHPNMSRALRRLYFVGGGAPGDLGRRRADQLGSAAAARTKCRRRRRSAAPVFIRVQFLYGSNKLLKCPYFRFYNNADYLVLISFTLVICMLSRFESV